MESLHRFGARKAVANNLEKQLQELGVLALPVFSFPTNMKAVEEHWK